MQTKSKEKSNINRPIYGQFDYLTITINMISDERCLIKASKFSRKLLILYALITIV